MKKKVNKELLNEELKRFKLLNEYDFYIGEDDGYDEYDKTDDLILGEEGEEEDENLPDDLPPDDSKTADVGDDVDIADLEDVGDEELGDEELGDELGDEELGDEEGLDDLGGEDLEPAEDEVELDVTELVQGTEEAKASADMANQKLDNLMGMLDNLEGKLNSMDGITSKIDNLENELEKRAPTPEEKIEMRSLDSYPYNLKLTDFWSEKEGQYDVMNTDDEAKPEEYTLTHDDVNDDYNESLVKNTFDEDNEYEEEDF